MSCVLVLYVLHPPVRTYAGKTMAMSNIVGTKEFCKNYYDHFDSFGSLESKLAYVMVPLRGSVKLECFAWYFVVLSI